ncbi:hypothetical protein PybrP1_000443 [[Pythium] brassicae (nom. inval.)]|nr:hypothetical protein PybrP1_000443 [[Pythium] brassicae (nom. inval.)]
MSNPPAPPSLSSMQQQQQQSQLQAGPTGLPPSPEFLPSISPSVVYSTAHALWSPQELHVFQRGLADFPADEYDNVTRYIKIAAMLPSKCVRDVAFKAKAMSLAHESMSMNRDQFAKRMRIAPYQPHDENLLLMHTMRSNLLSGKLDDNRDPMCRFRDNCNSVLSTLGDICNTIPPLSIKLDTSLLPVGAPSGQPDDSSSSSSDQHIL